MRQEPSNAGESRERSDAELVTSVRSGNRGAFVDIVARHQSMVCAIALGVLGDFAGSEDAGQETFLTAWRRLDDLREPAQLRPWLAQIARNVALAHLRRRKGVETLEDDAPFVDESPAPDARAASADDALAVRNALSKLPETYRVPLVLFYREGQSIRAVAEALGISEDAAKQRLARGREMLREQMTGVVERVLARTSPGAVFTVAIAVAIGALSAPATVAGAILAGAAAATSATTGTAVTASATASAAAPAAASTSTTLATVMSTSKALFATAALVTAVFVPVGYQMAGLRDGRGGAVSTKADVEGGEGRRLPTAAAAAGRFDQGPLFAEWRALHDLHGTAPESMPVLYQAINELKDPMRRRAFRAALIAEWAQVDPAGGLAHFLKVRDATQRLQFLEEWLARDAAGAVAALLAGPGGWESAVAPLLPQIARRAPARLGEVVERLPKGNYWSSPAREAFAALAERGIEAAREAALSVKGPNRDPALAGVARIWARSDLDGTIAWARSLPEGVDRDEVVRAALIGRASTDPGSALDRLGIVPPGGRDGFFASSIGGRVLREAAAADFDATVGWIATNPGQLGREDLLGLGPALAARLNSDAAGTLSRFTEQGVIRTILPAIDSALLNEAGGQRAAIWDWLDNQPESEAIASVRELVLRTAAWQEPELSMKLMGGLPATAGGEEQVRSVVRYLLQGGPASVDFESIYAAAPERIRPALLESGFDMLASESLGNPRVWSARLDQLPEASRTRGARALAVAWLGQSPEEARTWAASLAPGEVRTEAASAVVGAMAHSDPGGAATWLGALPPGLERDRMVREFVANLGPRQVADAWQWAVSIGDASVRTSAAGQLIAKVSGHDPALARQWIRTGPFTPEARQTLENIVQSTQRPGSR